MERLIRDTITRNREQSDLAIQQGLEDFFRNESPTIDPEAN